MHSKECTAKKAQQRMHSKERTVKNAQRIMHCKESTAKKAQQRMHKECLKCNLRVCKFLFMFSTLLVGLSVHVFHVLMFLKFVFLCMFLKFNVYACCLFFHVLYVWSLSFCTCFNCLSLSFCAYFSNLIFGYVLFISVSAIFLICLSVHVSHI